MATERTLYTQTFTGWRIWYVGPDGHLRGLNGQLWYAYRRYEALCTFLSHIHRPHENHAPDYHCNCGLWCFKKLTGLLESGDIGRMLKTAARSGGRASHPVQYNEHPIAFGQVHLWGRIVEHSLGYRAQYAYPKGIVVQDRELADAIRERYGCEVEHSHIIRDWLDKIERTF